MSLEQLGFESAAVLAMATAGAEKEEEAEKATLMEAAVKVVEAIG